MEKTARRSSVNFHQFIQDRDGWETISNERHFANDYVQVFTTTVKTPTRPGHSTWTVVHRKGAAVIAPKTRDGKYLLVRQERVPIRATIWEFPAGQIDEKSEHDEKTIHETALRELREETGHQLASDGSLRSLGYFFSSAGFTDEHSHLYLADPVERCDRGHSPDSTEAIVECRAFSAEELREMIAKNEIRDANTLSAFARLCALRIL
jgi:ADP-ribose pyrophosphatase